MKNRTIWVIAGIIVIVVMLLAGLLPLPGQKDEPTPLSEPSAPSRAAQ